jgi:acetylornithine deacetylase/succinyl-diaminopimelate desuccinylase-like protein
MLDDLKLWYKKNYDKLLNSYFEFLRFKTISANDDNEKEMIACSDWLLNYLKNIGFESQIIQTISYPIVFAEKIIDKKLPTLLIYGHYDVQPVDPLDKWLTDPFEPVIKENKVFARGASDNKGQVFYSIAAMHALFDLNKELGVNIKICIEGEEESSSKGLFSSLDSLKEKFKADYLLVVDFGIPDKNIPAITLGIRGISALSVEFVGSSIDLHSGEHGGLAYNPLRGAVEVLSKLIDENGKIRVENFYDDIEEVSEEIYDLDFDENKYKKTFKIKGLGGEKAFRGIRANWFRPTLEINGIGGGYFEKGFKTVIPARVQVKISSRLVPKQKPDKIAKLIKDFLEKNTPKEIDIKVEYEGGGLPLRANETSLIAKASAKAFEEVFGKPCRKILAGGSVPVIGMIADKLKCQLVMIGTALIDDNIHAPNEHFGLDRFEKGFLTVARILMILGQEK